MWWWVGGRHKRHRRCGAARRECVQTHRGSYICCGFIASECWKSAAQNNQPTFFIFAKTPTAESKTRLTHCTFGHAFLKRSGSWLENRNDFSAALCAVIAPFTSWFLFCLSRLLLLAYTDTEVHPGEQGGFWDWGSEAAADPKTRDSESVKWDSNPTRLVQSGLPVQKSSL